MGESSFHFGINMYATPTGAAWADLARRTENLGYDVLTLSDHIAGIINREFSRFSPIPALSAAAMCTEKLRFSMFVLCNDFRHPAALAKEIATLDVLSGGRVEIGLGGGWDRSEYGELGIDFEDGRVRVARMYESVAILRGLLDGKRPFTFVGDAYQIRDLEIWPKPVQSKVP